MSAAVFLLGSAVHAVETPDETTTNAPTAQAETSEAELKKKRLMELMNTEVTTVSRTESTLGESPAAITVITPEMIRRSGATTIPELFRMVPGMDVARIDNNKWAVGARGFNQRFAGNLLVQIDGRSLYNPLFAGVYWDTVDYPLEDIERIEIIRGPGASVWGANAVNGVINIITKSSNDTQGGLVSGGGGTEENGFGTFRYGGKISNDLYYRVYGTGFTRDEQFSAQGDPNDGWWGASGGLRLDWQASERDAVMFEGGFFRSVAGRKDVRAQFIDLSQPLTFTNVENEVTNGGDVLARWTHQFDKDNSWTLQAYWDRNDRNSDNGPTHFLWDTYDVDFQHNFPLGDRQKVVYGAGYRLVDAFLQPSSQDNGFGLNFLQPHRRPQLFSAFVQDQITLVEDKLSVTLGSKFEHNDHTGFEYQPSGRVLWTPTKRQTVWAAASRAVRTPTLAEDALAFKLLPFVSGGTNVFSQLVGNRDFQSEEVVAFEVGYRAQATDHLSLDVALFYNVYDNLKVTVPQPITANGAPPGTLILPLKPDNRMHGETYGLEWTATWQLIEWWRLYAAYTFLEIQLHRELPAVRSQEISFERESPEQQVYLQSSWNLPHNVEIDLIGRFVDGLSGFNTSKVNLSAVPNDINRYVSLDARVAWRPCPNVELEVVGQNLLDDHHPESGTSAQVRSPLVELQRSVYGKVTWWF